MGKDVIYSDCLRITILTVQWKIKQRDEAVEGYIEIVR